MPLPVLSKTWQFSVNQAVPAAGSVELTAAALWLVVKNSLKGFGTLPWSVRGSSDSVAAAMDTTDRWIAAGNLVWANPGAPHSWIVLRQTGVATNFEICIAADAAGYGNVTIAVSAGAGFTGGGTTARPTATDEFVLLSSGALGWSNLDADHVVHAMQSTDGQCTRVAVWRASTNLCTFLLFDKPANPTTGWTKPSVSIATGITAGYGNTYVALSSLASTIAQGYNTTPMVLALTGEGAVSAGSILPTVVGLGDATNDFDNTWPLFPIGLASITANHKGRHGSLFDLWWRPTGVGQADTFPNDVSRQFIAMGDLVLPWNGSVPVIA